MKKVFLLGLTVIAAMLTMTGCADVSHVAMCIPPQAHEYGFWGGTWHGMTMGFSFIGRLFSDNIAVYAVNNNGAWYDFGFVGGFFLMIKIAGKIISALLA